MIRGIALLSAMCLGQSAGAHPHVFVDAKAGFLFTGQGQLRGLRISWTYDAFTTLFLIDALDLDRDGDGQLNDEDRAAIVAGETDWPPDYNGDVYLEVAGQPRVLTRPENAVAGMEGDQITIVFDLPLAEPEALDGNPAILRLYDPVYYYAYQILPDDTLLQDLPRICEAAVIPFEPDSASAALQAKLAALSREETPEQEDVGRLFSDQVRLTCE
ncbi:DUF1007 family protein [Pararhodobacter oceanensis]|uniref:DUF1007 family protein n=1 Tax=Pararhodobacter oceanensis TaxID=2172121 RepID=UPI003A92F230